MALTIIIASAAGDTEMVSRTSRVFLDGTDELLEGFAFLSVAPPTSDPAAP